MRGGVADFAHDGEIQPKVAPRGQRQVEAGLFALVVSILYLSQFRAGLIDARVQSLLVQGEIIAGAIAGSATVETDTITIDPDKLLELQTGESYGPVDESMSTTNGVLGMSYAPLNKSFLPFSWATVTRYLPGGTPRRSDPSALNVPAALS